MHCPENSSASIDISPLTVPSGKRNTSLAFFTSYERSLLRNTWGSQRTRLTRDSFLPFSSCTLCLQPAIQPVACPQGDLFCHECIIRNLLAQRKEIERLKKDVERRGVEDEFRQGEKAREEEERALEDFERVSRGLEDERRIGDGASENRVGESTDEQKGKKRKAFVFDQDAARKNADADRQTSRRRIEEEKHSGPNLPSFWVPSLTPSTEHSKDTTGTSLKLHPLCPASQPETKHALSLKSLVTVHFSVARDDSSHQPASKGTQEQSSTGEKGDVPPICPSCSKPLSNTSRAVLAIPCGHVVCKVCATQFMTPSVSDPHATSPDLRNSTKDGNGKENPAGRILCYVCETDVTPETPKPADDGKETPIEENGKKKKKRKKGEEGGEAPRRGLVELKSEGTGFAGGGKNVVGREGVVFQC